MKAAHLICAIGLWASGLPGLAQVTSADNDAATKAISDAFSSVGSFAIPDSPAAALLGDSQITISRPQSIQMLAAEIGRYREKGKESPGVSLVLNPALMLAGKKITYREYNDNKLLRQIARMEISAGLTEAPADGSKPRRAAFGLSLTPYDAGDPRMDPALPTCMQSAYEAIKVAPAPTAPGSTEAVDVITAAMSAVPGCIKKLAAELPRKQRTSDSLKLGFGKGWASAGPDTTWQDGGWGVWIAGQYSIFGTNESGQGTRILARLKRSSLAQWDASALKWTKDRADDAAFQLRTTMSGGSTDVMAEWGYTRKTNGSANERRLSLGVEKLLMTDTWLILTASSTSGGDPSTPRTSILGRLKYNFSSAPLLGL